MQIYDDESSYFGVNGNLPFRLFYFQSGPIRITFRSDASVNGKGFLITYKAGLFFMIIPKLLPTDEHFFYCDIDILVVDSNLLSIIVFIVSV